MNELLLEIDWGLCAGHGVCAAAFGEAISLDPWGYPAGADQQREIVVPPELHRAARLAVSACPAVALRLRKPSTRLQ